jgi:hypothetical protein
LVVVFDKQNSFLGTTVVQWKRTPQSWVSVGKKFGSQAGYQPGGAKGRATLSPGQTGKLETKLILAMIVFGPS